MRLVFLGTDTHMLDAQSRQRARLRSYTRLVDHVTALIFARVPTVDVQEEDALRIIALPRRIGSFLWLVRTMRRNTHDTVISTQDPFELGLIGWMLARVSGTGFHVQIHTALFAPAFYRGSLRQWLQSWIATWVLHRADAIRVVSTPLREELVARGYDATRITVAPIIESLPEKIRTSAYTGGTLEVLCVARFVPVKNLANLLRGFSQFAATHDARLTLVGGGPDEASLRTLIHDLDLGAPVQILPWADDVAELYRASHLVALVSLYEGFGMAIIEALGYGVPVVITHLQGAEEYVLDGSNGVIAAGFDADAIAAALTRAADTVVSTPPETIRASLRVPTKDETDARLVASWETALR